MSKDIQWSEWKVHTGGECPKEFMDAINGIGCEGYFIKSGDYVLSCDFVSATPDNPITYRYEIKPKEVAPFAVVFDKNGACSAKWSLAGGVAGRSEMLKIAEANSRLLIFFDKHAKEIDRHDFTEDAA